VNNFFNDFIFIDGYFCVPLIYSYLLAFYREIFEMKTTIAITRQMGSAGSYLGEIIAARLNLRYVDREVLHRAAREFGIEPGTLTSQDEKLSSFWEKMLRGFTFGAPESRYIPPPLRSLADKELFDKQTQIMRVIAEKNDCVIVGWGASHVLLRHSKMITIFCHAPLGFRIKRVMQFYQAQNESDARKIINESDEMRKKYIAQMTGRDWACAENYDITINTDLLPLENIGEMMVNAIKQKGILTDS
jgi:cytidylate kinase